MQNHKLLPSIIAVLALLSGFPARAAEATTIDVRAMKRGLLDVKVEQHECGERGLGFSSLALSVIPPLIEAGLNQVGQLLVEASGKNDTSLTLLGNNTDASFYCIDRKAVLKKGPANEIEAQDSYYLAPTRIIISAPYQHKTKNGEFFSASFKFDVSEDKTAFRIVPTSINYPTYILNPRAFGAVVSIDISVGGTKLSTGILPLGMISCGRVGSVCNDADELATVGSGWLQFPLIPVRNILGDFNEVNSITTKKFRSLPITVSASLTELSTYDKFLAFLGGFLQDSKAELAKGIVATLPPLSLSSSIERKKAEADIAIARAEYRAYSAQYNKLLAEKADCKAQLEAWKNAIVAAVNGNILTSLTGTPPPCIRR